MSNNGVARAVAGKSSPLLSLSPELLSMVFDFCGISELRQLSLTCKTLREQTIDVVNYRRVDLSAHNLGRMKVVWDHQDRQSYAVRSPLEFDVEDLARKQHSFLKRVLDRPYLGKLIHDFTWTIRSCCDPDGSRRLLTKGKEPPRKCATDAIYPDTHMWEVLKLLTNVTKLDFACFQTSWDWDYLRQPPDVLFPAVTDLRLSGVMYRQIVETVLQSLDLAKLESLAIDNLQDPGHIGIEFQDPGRIRIEYPYLRLWSSWSESPPSPIPQDTEDTTVAGTMRGILPLLQGRCDALRSFLYRKAGLVVRDRRGSVARDKQCYQELGLFLSSVAKTLQTFHFEQGLPARYMIEQDKAGTLSYGVSHHQRVHQNMRPMDEAFLDHVLPTLHREQWPSLKILRIIGVGRWDGILAMSNLMKARLRKRLGQEVDIKYQEVSDVPCEEYKGEPVWNLV